MQHICCTIAMYSIFAFCIKIVLVYALCLLVRREIMFQLKPDRKETENKSIRFPIELINRIEEAIVGKNVSFTAFVIQACEYALENMEVEEKKKVNS